ncbi:MAG: TGS domain-containing protein [Lautropia sp.]|nr:TGS domain-containing protein [Lautropia sp.]
MAASEDVVREDLVEWARNWLQAHGDGDWNVPGGGAPMGESRAGHGAGVEAVLQLQGADWVTQLLGLLVCSEPWPDQDRLDTHLGEELGAYMGTLLENCRRLMALSVGPMISWQDNEGQSQLEVLRRMTLAMARDVRVVMVSLASVLQSLRHVVTHELAGKMDVAGLARVAMQVLAPLANRLGLYRIKWEMEDLAFRCLDPERYRTLANAVEQKRPERDAFVANAAAELRALLDERGIKARVKGRSKHLYSIHNKLKAKNLSLEKLLDLRGLRVMVDNLSDCYAALDVVHQRWEAEMDELDDYIAYPKPNGYQSLHTVVIADDGRPLEVQIRTQAMHDAAEYGLAAHWRYKEKSAPGGAKTVAPSLDGQARISWLRQLLAWQQELGTRLSAGDETSTADDSVIFVMTPQGRVIELPKASTPVDFAYHVHTSLGHRCRGARVDGRLIPLNTPLSNGQVVEIVQARAGGSEEAGPSRDWLNPSLGFVRSGRARAKVRQWFNAQERGAEQLVGRERVEKALAREGRTSLSLDELASRLGCASSTALFAAVAREKIGQRALEAAIRNDAGAAPDVKARVPEPVLPKAAPKKMGKGSGHDVLVMGVDFLMTHLARCCHPVPPDEIRGFVTRGRGVSVHRKGCPALAALLQQAPERELAVSWGSSWQEPVRTRNGQSKPRRFSSEVLVVAEDRTGLLRDLLDMFAREQCNLVSVRSHTVKDMARFNFVLDVPSAEVLDKLKQVVRQIPGVTSCRRV